MTRALCMLIGLSIAGCQPGPKTETPATPEAAEPAKAPPPATAGDDRSLSALADAIESAPDVDVLRRRYVARLPSPPDAERPKLEAQATDANLRPSERIAATVALGTYTDPARGLAIRDGLNTMLAKTPIGTGRDSVTGVRLMTTIVPDLAKARAALPEAIADTLPETTPGEARRWAVEGGEAGLPDVSAADAPFLLRSALHAKATSTRLALLLAATLDVPSVTETLLHMPGTHLGEPRPRRDLVEWALVLHSTLPGVPERVRAALEPAGTRAHDRAVAVLTGLRDPAVIAAASATLDRLSNRADADPLPFDLGAFIDAAGEWTEAEALTLALARYAESSAPLRNRARKYARKAGVGPDVSTLLDRVAADPNDARSRRIVRPLLDARHGPRLAALLAKDRWTRAGFFHWVRMIQRVPEAAMTADVSASLALVAAEHPDGATREWALSALSRGPDPLPPVVEAAAAKGSKAAVRTVIMRAPDPFAAVWTRISGRDDAVRRAAYETLIAPRTLPFEPSAAQAARIIEHTAQHLTARPEDPWIFLRAIQQYTPLSAGARTPALEAAMARALRPYCLVEGPDKKPSWEALVTIASLDAPEAKAVIADAVKSVPTAGARAVMRARLNLPADPNDPVPEPPRSTGGGGH